MRRDPLEKLVWEDVLSCPLCHGVSFRQRSRHWWRALRINLVQCKGCDLVLQSPRLSPQGLGTFYEEHYRTEIDSASQESLFQRGMRRGAYIQEFLVNNGISCENRRVVEVGCGYGGILEAFHQVGGIISGCDLEPNAAKFALGRGLDVRQGGIEVLSDVAASADIVILSHVLEHIPEPIEFLAAVASLLKPGGVLYVEVPGIENPRVIKQNGAVQPGHLIYFNKEILQKTCETADFKHMIDNDIVQALYHGPPDCE